MKRSKLTMRAGLLALCLIPLGCSHNGSGGNGGGGGGSGGGGAGGGGGGGGTTVETLVVTPANPVLSLTTGQPAPTVQFTATKSGKAVTASWALDRGELGTIDANGLFTPTGALGGVAIVTATAGAKDSGTTKVTIHVTTIDNGDPAYTPTPVTPGAGGYGGVGGDGPGAPGSTGQQGTLGGTPTPDAAVKLLYPYNGTVWPRGLLAPLLQWDPGTHKFDSAYVHITEANYEYQGYFTANSTTSFRNLPLPQAAWHQLTYSNGGEMADVSIVLAEGGKLYGPYTESWKIAAATLKGTIYYNSYGTYLVKNSGTDGLDAKGQQYGAATLAIKAGMTSPVLVAGVTSLGANGNGTGCRVCHTVAANGKSLVTQASNSSASDYSQTQYLDLLNDTTAGSGSALAAAAVGEVYPALYPDGSLMMGNAGGFNGGFYPLPPTSQLFALPAGTVIPAVMGLPSNFQATLPVFSPDGKALAFNFWTGSFTGGPTADQRSLGVLDFDLASKSFSNPRIGYTPPAGRVVTFSSFLPDSGGVVFAVSLGSPSNTFASTWRGDTSELWWYDIKSNQAHRLDQLNGIGNNSVSSLANVKHSSAVDATLNYEPTVNPIASGGYAWVVFTSRRVYGDVANADPWLSDPRAYDATTTITDKKLWVAAFDLGQDEIATATDPSHPAFYLPAQEIHAGNARGFWSVDPCHADGASCETGDECCGGYCSSENGALICTSQKPQCSAEFDKCTTSADCCGGTPTLTCINQICTQASPIS